MQLLITHSNTTHTEASVMFRMMIMELSTITHTIMFMALNTGKAMSLLLDDAY